MATTAELLQGLIDSKAAIVAALEAKGVTVPEGAKFSELAAMVESIESGGDEELIALWETDRATATSITIPEGVTSIGTYAFYNCAKLTSLVLPENITSIGSYAFWNCRILTSLVAPNGVKTIGERAFQWCSSLASLTLPESVTSIGANAFSPCPKTCDITFGKTMAEVSAMSYYPWGIASGAVIHCTDGDLTVS